MTPGKTLLGLILIAAAVLLINRFGGNEIEIATVSSPGDIDLSEYGFVIDFIDVGQGDCELLRSGDSVVLIDGGENEYASKVNAYLRKCGVDKIDCYIATHPHSDHIGAAPGILKNFGAGTVITTAFSDTNIPVTSTYERFLDACDSFADEYVEVTAGDKFSFGDIKLEILAPYEESEEYNNMSVCCLVTCKGTKAMLCGDAGKEIENAILEKGTDIKADIFKVSHHGSRSSNSKQFTEKIDPSVCVICCGNDNSYGHPHNETVSTLSTLGITPLRTDKNGSITVCCKGNKIDIRTEK